VDASTRRFLIAAHLVVLILLFVNFALVWLIPALFLSTAG
jgi:hypothetical protein